MKIAYLIPYSEQQKNTSHIGVNKKVTSQILNLQKLSVDVYSDNISISKKSLGIFIISWISAIRKIKSYLSSPKYDILYTRTKAPHLFVPLIGMSRNVSVVFEIQDIRTKQVKISCKYRFIQNILNICILYSELLFGKYIASHADAIVSVTPEINNYYKKRTKNSIKYLTLGNGIEVPSYHTRKIPSDSDKLHVLIVANTHPWHGIDRFIRGLYEYTGNKNIILHIVGDGPALPELKSLTKKLKLEDHVIFHGFKSGAELDAMFDMCHIAIGSLAAFRSNLNELSSLKSREYCARGIPFIMASKDADFPENWDYVQMVPANETPIDMNTVVEFADRVMSDTEHPQKMRRYAEEHLDWLAKMKTLKEFLESL